MDYYMRNTVPVVALDGRVDATNIHTPRKQLLGLLDEGQTRLVIDLSGTSFLDSTGMATLVSVLKRARLAGGEVRVVEPADASVRRILRLTRLDLVLNLLPTREAALAAF
jgi:anti-sigma B factor antagonist